MRDGVLDVAWKLLFELFGMFQDNRGYLRHGPRMLYDKNRGVEDKRRNVNDENKKGDKGFE